VVKSDGDGPVRDVDRETALLQHRSAFGERWVSTLASSAASTARSWTTPCAGSTTRCRRHRKRNSRNFGWRIKAPRALMGTRRPASTSQCPAGPSR
jgi:hypothetical protein